MKSLFLTLCIFLGSTFAFAGGSLGLSGKIHSFDSKNIEVEDKFKIYTLLRDKLGPDQNLKIDQSKVGSTINLMVPFEAIDKVRRK